MLSKGGILFELYIYIYMCFLSCALYLCLFVYRFHVLGIIYCQRKRKKVHNNAPCRSL